MNADDAITALKEALKVELRPVVRAEMRRELEGEPQVERAKLGKRFITKRQFWEKLCVSEDSLDELRRTDPNFPEGRQVLRRVQFCEAAVDAYMDTFPRV